MASDPKQRRRQARREYIPALRFHALTRYFDALMARTLKEERFRSLLIDQAMIVAGHRVLDVGCGTGTLAVMVKRRNPAAEVVGLDADAEALRIASSKAEEADVEIEFHEALAWEAPFSEGSYDRVLSSLVFHHLRPADKRRTLARIRDWLRPGGELHIADWGRAQNGGMRALFLAVQLLDGFATTRENVEHGLVPCLLESGFAGAEETHREATLFGTLSLYRAWVNRS